MNHLAIDLGTKCGHASRIRGVRTGGTWKLATTAELDEAREDNFDRRCDPRFLRLLGNLRDVENLGPLDCVTFEDVKFSKYTLQTQLWSSLRAAIWTARYINPSVNIQCVDTSALKVWGANHGSATKEMMGAWLVKKHPGLFEKNIQPTKKTESVFVRERQTGRPVDDNEVDAQHLLDYAIFNFS